MESFVGVMTRNDHKFFAFILDNGKSQENPNLLTEV